MNKEVYEVTKDEYTGFVDQMLPEACLVKRADTRIRTSQIILSKKNKKLLCKQEFDKQTNTMHYYVYNMPDDDERRPAPAKRIMNLQTREEVQAFLNAISKIQKEKEESHD